MKRPSIVFGYLAEGDVTLPGRLVERYRDISADCFQWCDFAMDPALSIASVKQARYEIAALVIAGLVTVSGSAVKVAAIRQEDPTLHERMAILHLLDPTVDMEEFSKRVPAGAPNAEVPWLR